MPSMPSRLSDPGGEKIECTAPLAAAFSKLVAVWPGNGRHLRRHLGERVPGQHVDRVDVGARREQGARPRRRSGSGAWRNCPACTVGVPWKTSEIWKARELPITPLSLSALITEPVDSPGLTVTTTCLPGGPSALDSSSYQRTKPKTTRSSAPPTRATIRRRRRTWACRRARRSVWCSSGSAGALAPAGSASVVSSPSGGSGRGHGRSPSSSGPFTCGPAKPGGAPWPPRCRSPGGPPCPSVRTP